ncbi:phosphatase PAP2 family protein [Thermomonospora catenispora]|nr:phosphatase PAP2 family protein [Thermomonospora catenispora]
MVHTAPPVSRGPRAEPTAGPARRPAARRTARPITVPPVWRELTLIALFYTAYTLIRLVLNDGGTAAAYGNADRILALERALGVDVELGLNRWLLGEPWLARAANYYYGIAHFAVTLAIVIWLYRRRPEHYRRLRTALMAATAVALLGYWLYPLAPPRFLPEEGFVDPVQALGSWGLYSGQSAGALANQYAAMPSMHAGWAVWCGLVLARLGPRPAIRVIGALYPLVTVLVILATANHYLLDAIVGTALVLGALALSRARPVRRSRPRDAVRAVPAAAEGRSRPVPRPRPAPSVEGTPCAAGVRPGTAVADDAVVTSI